MSSTQKSLTTKLLSKLGIKLAVLEIVLPSVILMFIKRRKKPEQKIVIVPDNKTVYAWTVTENNVDLIANMVKLTSEAEVSVRIKSAKGWRVAHEGDSVSKDEFDNWTVTKKK